MTDMAAPKTKKKHRFWFVVAIMAIVIAMGILLLVVGALRDPTGSMHAVVGSAIWATFGPHLVALGMGVVVLSGLACWGGPRRISVMALILSAAACAGSAAITFSIVSAAYLAGGSANPVYGLWLSSMMGRGPDHEVVFSRVKDSELQIAIYQPEPADAKSPVLIYIHGGGFKIGSNVEVDADLRWFADKGWLVFSVDYRLWTDELATWDLAPGDIACAVAWVGKNAADYGGAIQHLAVLGDSAGGNLAINYSYAVAQGQLQSDCGDDLPVPKAVIVQYPAVDPLAIYEHGFPVPGFEPKMLVRGYVGGEPNVYPERIYAVSSYRYLSAEAPATLIFAPEKDGLVPSWSVYRFADYARLAGVDIELVRVPFASHVYNQLASNSIGNQLRLSVTQRYLLERGLAPETAQ